MPSFADSIFLFVLALLLFGPKKLPVLARELGKWMGEFRRASNEFKMQMEDELRASEQADRQKQIAAMEAAAPIPPALDEPAEPEHPHLRHSAVEPAETENRIMPSATGSPLDPHAEAGAAEGIDTGIAPAEAQLHEPATQTADGSRLVPIATSGSLNMMPPATGLPTPRSSRPNGSPLSGLVDSIPEVPSTPPAVTSGDVGLVEAPETESLAHGD